MPNAHSTTEYKSVKGVLDASAEGTISAVVSTFGNVDLEGDVCLASFWQQGETLPMVWAHDWQRPIGIGTIDVQPDKAVFNGKLFLDTIDGHEAYTKMRHMADIQEFSFGYRVTDSEYGTKDGQHVRFLKAGERFEVSPVLVGANRETRLLGIKSAETDSKTTWDSSYISNLPDSAFAVILPGGGKDDSGKTTPRSLRKLPHHKADGSIDLPHLRNALSRLPQSSLSGDAKTKAETHLEKHANAEQIGDRGKGLYVDEPMENSYEDLSEDISEQMIAQGFADPDDHVCTVATFPTYAYVSVCDEYGMGEPSYYRVDYTLDDMGDPVVSNPTAVEAQLVFQPLEQPGLQYAGHTERLLAAVRGWTARSKSLADLRRERKEGRTFSAANVARMTTVLQSVRDAMDEMDAMLTAAAPKEPQKAQEPDALRGVEFDLMARRLSLQRLEIAV